MSGGEHATHENASGRREEREHHLRFEDLDVLEQCSVFDEFVLDAGFVGHGAETLLPPQAPVQRHASTPMPWRHALRAVPMLRKLNEPLVDDWAVTIEFRVDADLVESCAFGLIYVLGLLSFHDGRPRGVSGKWFDDDDEFTAADMLAHLEFQRGKLVMYVDYLRGRCIKTDVEVSSDGRVILKTVNRGQAATRWVDRLKGKKFLSAVES